MKTVLAVLVFFVLLTSPVNVWADLMYMTGNALKDRLDEEKGSSERSVALGYITGVHDTASRIVICNPGQVSVTQLADIVRKYLAEHPGQLDNVASDLVIKALASAFSCRK
jgi:Rap1a immunity proteins